MALIVFAVTATIAASAPPPAPFRFAKAVADGMVLQAAPKRSMIWGFVDANATVVVEFNGKKTAAIVGPDQARGLMSTWRAVLPPTPASFDEYNITATSGNVTLKLSGVMFGDVWICSGQSNSQYLLYSFCCCCFDINPYTIRHLALFLGNSRVPITFFVVEYTIGSPTCWNESNINCTVHDAQCSYGCVNQSGAEIAAMADYDKGVLIYIEICIDFHSYVISIIAYTLPRARVYFWTRLWHVALDSSDPT